MKKKILKPRLPMEMVLKLRRGGGVHSTERGERGYNRKREKARLRRETTF